MLLSAAPFISGAADPVVVTPPANSLMSRVSFEAIGAMRHVNLEGKAQWGAGAALLYEFNKSVYGFGRAISYATDDWRGSTIDESTVGVEAVLWNNGKLNLSALGGVSRDFNAQDWGFGLGLCPAVKLNDNFTLFAGYEVRLWNKQKKDGLATFGVNFSF